MGERHRVIRQGQQRVDRSSGQRLARPGTLAGCERSGGIPDIGTFHATCRRPRHLARCLECGGLSRRTVHRVPPPGSVAHGFLGALWLPGVHLAPDRQRTTGGRSAGRVRWPRHLSGIEYRLLVVRQSGHPHRVQAGRADGAAGLRFLGPPATGRPTRDQRGAPIVDTIPPACAEAGSGAARGGCTREAHGEAHGVPAPCHSADGAQSAGRLGPAALLRGIGPFDAPDAGQDTAVRRVDALAAQPHPRELQARRGIREGRLRRRRRR